MRLHEICLFTILFQMTHSARVLMLWPYNMRSHFVIAEPLLLALQARGHHLTVISPFPQKQPLQNFTDIDISDLLPQMTSLVDTKYINEHFSGVFDSVKTMTQTHVQLCDKVLRDRRFMDVLDEKYDLVITQIFGSDCANYFAYKIKAPVISWSTGRALPWVTDRVGLPDNPSYITQYYSQSTEDMNFSQRLWNSFVLLYAKAAYYYYSELPTHRLLEDVFGEKLPTVAEVNKRTSLVFVNSHFSLSQSRPITPNVVEVAGINIKKVPQLPKDLKETLDNAKIGAIVVSFGSLVKFSSLPKKTIDIFMKVFSELPQTVVLKCEEDIPDFSPNVHLRKWLPQQDILAHPNIVAAMLHGGMASTVEAVHFARPLIGVPFFTDQYQNINNIVNKGAGVKLDIHSLTEQDLRAALDAVLKNTSYKDNMAKLSAQFRDRPATPLETAVYWAEYIIRHKGADHLRPVTVHLPLYQYLLLDVLAVGVSVLAAAIYLVYLTVRGLYRLGTSGQTRTGKRSKSVKSD